MGNVDLRVWESKTTREIWKCDIDCPSGFCDLGFLAISRKLQK